MRRKYEIGVKYGSLTILSFASEENHGKYKVLCQCDCGNKKIVNKYELGKGIKSCGCFSRDNLIKMNTKHNLCNHRLHSIWTNMKQRCYNPKTPNYHCYGERGVKVFDSWKQFSNFYEWAIKNGYEEKLTLDRIDVNGNYEPSNCKWVTRKEQARNRRDNFKITINNETKLLCEWSEIHNIRATTIMYRYKKGIRNENLFS